MMRTTTILALLLAIVGSAHAQETVLHGVQLVRSSNGATQTITTEATSNQTIILPAAAATATGQGLKISAVSGNTMTLAWDTPSAGLTNSSSQLTVNADDNTAWSTGPLISVEVGKKYRVVGLFQMQRGTTAGGSNDVFQMRLNTPASTYAQFSIECFDCPAGTTGVPSFSSGTAPATGTLAIDGPTIDPNGNQTNVVFTFRIEGLFIPGASGSTRLTFNKSVGADITTMLAGSYWALQEIE